MSRTGMHRNLRGRAAARQLRGLAAAGTGACLLTAGMAAWVPGVAQGQASALSFTVNTTADAHDAHPGDGKCADAAGQCTLRAALEEADASPPGGTVSINVPAGYNLSTDSSCGLSLKTDLVGVNPMLKPLADNGGRTLTQGLPRSSPAVNAGGLPSKSSCPAADQRGESRPWGPACDIGAFELHYKL